MKKITIINLNWRFTSGSGFAKVFEKLITI